MTESVTMDESTTGTRLREQTVKVKDDLKELGRIGREASKEKLGHAKEVAGTYLEKGKQRATVVEDSVVTYVREKPVKSLAMAIGAGALLGFLLSRR